MKTGNFQTRLWISKFCIYCSCYLHYLSIFYFYFLRIWFISGHPYSFRYLVIVSFSFTVYKTQATFETEFIKKVKQHLSWAEKKRCKKKLVIVCGEFPVNFAKFLRTPFFLERLWWLLLKWCPLVITWNKKHSSE